MVYFKGEYCTMSNKKTNFELDKTLKKMLTPSIFDRLVKEVDASEIPTEYIDRISVFYNDGNIVELSGNEITHPVPVNKTGSGEEMDDSFNSMREVKVFIDTSKLEMDVNKEVEALLGKFC